MVVVRMELVIDCTLLVLQRPRRLEFIRQRLSQVTEIYDNTGDVVRLTGVTSETYNQFNSLYRITEIDVGAAKSFRAFASDVSISGVTTAGIGTSPLDNAAVYVTGESLRITNLSYETNSGIATLTSASNHGLRVNSKVRINTGITTFNGDPFEGSFVVTKNVSATQFAVRIGAAATTLAPTSALLLSLLVHQCLHSVRDLYRVMVFQP